MMLNYCGSCNQVWPVSADGEIDLSVEEHIEAQNEDCCGHRCTHDDIGRCEEGMAITVYVNVYALDSAYGGPEEGGWNRTVQEPVASVQLRGKILADWEDVGGPESGPRLTCNGFEVHLDGPSQKVRDALREYYEESYSAFGGWPRISLTVEFSEGRYRSFPSHYC